MKRITVGIFAICGLLATPTFGQSYSIGIKGGLSIPNLTAGGKNTPVSEGYSSRLGTDWGVYLEKHLTQKFSISVGVEYSEQGGKKSGFQALPSESITNQLPMELSALSAAFPTYSYSNFESTAKFNYLMVPVLARAGWQITSRSPIRLYIATGPFAGLLLKSEQKTTSTGPIYFDSKGTVLGSNVVYGALLQQQVPEEQATAIINSLPLSSLPSSTRDLKSETRAFNAGILGFLGISYSFGPSALFVEGGGNYGFVTIQKNTKYGANRIGAGVVTVGYSYTL